MQAQANVVLIKINLLPFVFKSYSESAAQDMIGGLSIVSEQNSGMMEEDMMRKCGYTC